MVSYKIRYDRGATFPSALRGLGGQKSSVSSLYEFYSMKEKIFESYSTLSITEFSDAKELVKMKTEVHLDCDPKDEGYFSALEKLFKALYP